MKIDGNFAVLGLQWGDEGKGKIIDLLAENADIVVRFHGGDNAGHTVVVKGRTQVLHLLPCGILQPHPLCVIGNGVVVNLQRLLAEIEEVRALGIDVHSRLRISGNCPILLPSHIAIDSAREGGEGAIGTTCRGIGPVYEDKIARRALRINDMTDPAAFSEKMRELIDYHNFWLQQYHGAEPVDAAATIDQCLQAGEALLPQVTDTGELLMRAAREGRKIMFEGAQGSLLDIDHGTYPFVTSSTTTIGAVFSGAGVGIDILDRVVGVSKGYATRVGSGPFPTQANGSDADHLSSIGREFGATTGRPRRCGWLDLPALRRTLSLSGVDTLVLTKLDAMGGLQRVRLCHSYRIDGREEQTPNLSTAEMEVVEPVYRDYPGWLREDFAAARKYGDLPQTARDFIAEIERSLGLEVALVSTGQERDQYVIKGDA